MACKAASAGSDAKPEADADEEPAVLEAVRPEYRASVKSVSPERQTSASTEAFRSCNLATGFK